MMRMRFHNLISMLQLTIGIQLRYLIRRFNREIVHIPSSDYIYVCLVNTGNGTPFISSLELRPLNASMYQTTNFKGSLTTIGFGHFDIGNNDNFNGSNAIRYKDDIYDRLWSPIGCLAVAPQLTSTSTTSQIDMEKSLYKPPSVVMNTACTAADSNNSLVFFFPKEQPSDQLYFVLHFAQLQPNQGGQGLYRLFVNGESFGTILTPYLTAESTFLELPISVHSNSRGYLFSINRTENSTAQPVINALEAFKSVNILQSQTSDQETAAMLSIKTTYHISRNWQGDPCAPQKFVWDGLRCSYNRNDPPIIISLNLSSSGITSVVSAAISNLTMLQILDLSKNELTGLLPDFLGKLTSLRTLNLSSSGVSGDVPAIISNLTMLQSLNLSHNRFSGLIPDFLGNLTSLRTLSLEGNNFTGPIPVILLAKWHEGMLSLSIEGLPVKGSNNGSKWKGKKVIISVVVLVGALFGFLILALLVVLRRKTKKQGEQLSIAESGKEKDQNRYTLEPKHKEFTYLEIVNITNNFQKELGRGSYGTVYYGLISEHTEVAVKMYSSSSFDEGFKELQLEANVLMNVHHRNLTSLIGYCIDGTRVGIIYEYMANGDLRRHLLERSLRVLSWQERMQIAVDVAQGLEYMHHGCKPPIVHRDVKSSNILLDQNFKAKIADFGLCKPFPNESATHVSTKRVAGTKGYLDPTYQQSGRLTQRSDVYSFGVVLLEIITSKPAINLIQWVSQILEKGDVKDVVDPRLVGEFDIPSAIKALQIAIICVSYDATERPTMNNVVVELRQCLFMEMTRREILLSKKSFHDSQESEISPMSTEVLYVGR